MKKGDQAFAVKNYSLAKKYYGEATQLEPGKVYPQAQLDKIAKLEAAIAKKATTPKPKPVAKPTEKPAAKDKEEFLDALAQQYGEGVHEEKYTEGTKEITRRVVVKGGKAHEYKFVKHNWGGKYYFKDDEPITETTWTRETKK